MVMGLMRQGWRNESGQVLPITVLFMGLIIGAAAISIDVAKVSALRNQAQTATSAAALAAAQTLARELQSGYNASANSDSIQYPSNPTAVADMIYQSNIKTAIPNNGLDSNPVVHYYLGTSKTPITVLPSTITASQLPIYVTVQASGSTVLNFASALGISMANVKPLATAVVDPQAEANTAGMVPLAMPASANLPLANPYGSDGWDSYLMVSKIYDAFRGSANGGVPSWVTTGTPINFHQIYGAGGMGWIEMFNSYQQLAFQNYIVAGSTGSSYWNDLSKYGIVDGATVYFPVANPTPTSNKGENAVIPIVGFITAKILNVPNTQGTNAGFEFKVISQLALNDTSNFSIGSSYLDANYVAQLVSNNNVP
ncbi:hypothetical protein CO251_12925 [Sulfobacillus sp. hq2]|nr:hypothetical protein CO251_12925 [Sulfobacillus sp. hq2]